MLIISLVLRPPAWASNMATSDDVMSLKALLLLLMAIPCIHRKRDASSRSA